MPQSVLNMIRSPDRDPTAFCYSELSPNGTDIVETVSFETETWLKLRDRNLDRDLKSRDCDPRLEIRDRDLKPQNLCTLLKLFEKKWGAVPG